MAITIQFAERCAWRAFYISRTTMADGYGRHQFLHMGVDPKDGVRPQFFGSIGNPWNRRGRSLRWRLPLPRVAWKFPAGPVHRACYRLSSKFWHGVDGRYGWGTKAVQP